MVWAIAPRLIVSNAHKSEGTNGPNHAGRVLVGSAMEVSSGGVTGRLLLHVEMDHILHSGRSRRRSIFTISSSPKLWSCR